MSTIVATAARKKAYLDRNLFHEELTKCKKENKLTDKSVKMFQLLSREFSRNYYFDCDDDRQDAIATAMSDLVKYWRNFKESNVVQLVVNRNFVEGDKISITIEGYGKLVYKASMKTDPAKRTFAIGATINNSLGSLLKLIKTSDDIKMLDIFIDKIKRKVTLMDKHNGDNLSIKSYVQTTTNIDEHFVKTSTEVDRHFFNPPPNAFSYFTSIVNNACLKSINKLTPKHCRNGNQISMDSMNQSGNGMFNLM